MSKYNLFNYFDRSLTRDNAYIVQKGDSLYKIAKKVNSTVDEIMSINMLKSTLIYPDQVLIIPARVPSGAIYFKEYVTKTGDTLDVIAHKNGVTIESIASHNDLSKIELAPEQTLQIGYKATTTHIIEPDDTYQIILQKYDLKLEDLVDANSRNWFAPGETINLK